MPKSKPDIVHSVRLELQETERATLEAALAGRFVTNSAMAAGNLLKGVGAALEPFSGALTALAAVWIADQSWDQLRDRVLDPIVDWIREPIIAQFVGDYQTIVAWLNTQYAMQGWDFLYPDNSSMEAWRNSAEGISMVWRGGGRHPTLGQTYFGVGDELLPDWLVDRFDSFIFTMKQNTAMSNESKSPAEWWVEFYPYAEFENEIIWWHRYQQNR